MIDDNAYTGQDEPVRQAAEAREEHQRFVASMGKAHVVVPLGADTLEVYVTNIGPGQVTVGGQHLAHWKARGPGRAWTIEQNPGGGYKVTLHGLAAGDWVVLGTAVDLRQEKTGSYSVETARAAMHELRDAARRAGMGFRDRDPHVADLAAALDALERYQQPDCPKGHPGRFRHLSEVGEDVRCVACERNQALDKLNEARAYRAGMSAACGQPEHAEPYDHPAYGQGHAHAKQLLDEFARRVDRAQDRASEAEKGFQRAIAERDQLSDAREGLVKMLADREALLLAYEHKPDSPEPPIVRGALDAQQAAEQRLFAAKAEATAQRSALAAAYAELWQTYGPSPRLGALYDILEAAMGDQGSDLAKSRAEKATAMAAGEFRLHLDTSPIGGDVRCRDCSRPYVEHGADVTLPDDDWKLLHPEQGGVLCGTCIARRAAALGAIAVRARLEMAGSIAPAAPAGLADTGLAAQALASAKDVLNTVVRVAPGYDWNADPQSLTLLVGQAHKAIDEALAGSEFVNPVSQVYFRAGLLVARHDISARLESDASTHDAEPVVADVVRGMWWPSLGPDPGEPRQLEWGEVTSGEYGTPPFRAKGPGELSASTEALPVAWQFLQLQDDGAAHAAGG